MGSCISSESKSIDFSSSTAKVISINGDLHEYPVPIAASQVLQIETNDRSSIFICNSDKLYFDDYIPPLDSSDLLQENQLYFLLPISRLRYPLSTSDMATLAVKASAALVDGSKKKGGWRKKRTRISPLLDVKPAADGGVSDGFKRFEKGSLGVSRSGSRKLQKSASRRAKISYKSFRAKLTTIHEGSVAE